MPQAAKRAEIDDKSVGLVRKFDKKKKKLQRQLDEDNMKEDEAISKLKDLQQENVALNDDLLELQLRQMDADDRCVTFFLQFCVTAGRALLTSCTGRSIMSEFEQRYELLVKSFIDTAQQNFFGKVRELENAFFDKAVAQAQAELEEFAAGKLDDISEDAQVCLLSLYHLAEFLRMRMHMSALS